MYLISLNGSKYPLRLLKKKNIPVTSSFSAMNLNCSSCVYMHKELAECINLEDVAKEFISAYTGRLPDDFFSVDFVADSVVK